MQDRSTKRGRLGLMVGLCVLAVSTGLGISAANGQDARPESGAVQKQTLPASAAGQKGAWRYYVDFRARTAASYGHAFVWYGRVDQRAVEVAGLHPATDSVIPYIIGHILPVPSETGASYGDLDEQYVTAKFRVLMTEPDGKRVHAYIKHLQASSPLWNAATYNCVAFIQDIARYMGLRVPGNHLLYPEDWVNGLRQLNGGRQIGRMPPSQAASAASYPTTREAAAR